MKCGGVENWDKKICLGNQQFDFCVFENNFVGVDIYCFLNNVQNSGFGWWYYLFVVEFFIDDLMDFGLIGVVWDQGIDLVMLFQMFFIEFLFYCVGCCYQ